MSGPDRIVLVPLDERPVSLTLPGQVAALAGVEVQTPCEQLLPRRRAADDVAGQIEWLRRAGQTASGAVVSLEGLGFGGLIPSRIGHERFADVLARWSVLEELACPVHAAVVVPRAPSIDDATEEPEYWADHGTALHAVSAAWATDSGVAAALANSPGSARRDWLRRRHRQYLLAHRAVGLIAEGAMQSLIVGVDDSSPLSLSALDAADLRGWVDRLEVGDRVQVRPGTDECGAVLVSRTVALSSRIRPQIGIVSGWEDLDQVPAYDESPLWRSSSDHVIGCGGIPSLSAPTTDVDGILVIHGPQGPGDWALHTPGTSDPERIAATLRVVRASLELGAPVAVADVAHPNGADPALVEVLLSQGLLGSLSGYAAWNTAGNALGTAAATLVLTVVARTRGSYDHAAAQDLLALRVAEDWGWMTQVRPWVRAQRGTDPLRHDHIDPDDPVVDAARRRLSELLRAQPWLCDWEISRLRLPWDRTFEVDLHLKRSG